MTMGELLRIQPSELKFPFEVRKQSVCALQLANKTDQYVAFKVKTTNPKRYCVKPNAGIVLPNSLCNVTVTMQAPKEAPPDMQCRDKFLVQSVIVPYGTTTKDINQEMFNRDNAKFVDEFKLRVVFVPANPPSPVPEEDEEGTSPGTSSADDEIRKSETVAQFLKQTVRNAPDSEEIYEVATLKDEKTSTTKQNEKLLGELEHISKYAITLVNNHLQAYATRDLYKFMLKHDLMQKQSRHGGGSIIVLLFGVIIGISIGYFIWK